MKTPKPLPVAPKGSLEERESDSDEMSLDNINNCDHSSSEDTTEFREKQLRQEQILLHKKLIRNQEDQERKLDGGPNKKTKRFIPGLCKTHINTM